MNELHTFLSYLTEYELRGILRTIEAKLDKDKGNFKLNQYRDAVENALILLKASK